MTAAVGLIDLRSDTVTRPSSGMRAAIAAAPVGDDQFGEDPTVNLLQERVASLLGEDAALWLPTGTMANQVALRPLTVPGDDVIVSRESHAVWHETRASAANVGVQFTEIGSRGLHRGRVPHGAQAAGGTSSIHRQRSSRSRIRTTAPAGWCSRDGAAQLQLPPDRAAGPAQRPRERAVLRKLQRFPTLSHLNGLHRELRARRRQLLDPLVDELVAMQDGIDSLDGVAGPMGGLAAPRPAYGTTYVVPSAGTSTGPAKNFWASATHRAGSAVSVR